MIARTLSRLRSLKHQPLLARDFKYWSVNEDEEEDDDDDSIDIFLSPKMGVSETGNREIFKINVFRRFVAVVSVFYIFEGIFFFREER